MCAYTVTLPTSKVIPFNFPFSKIIFRKCMHRIIWKKMCNETCKTIQFPNKIQNQKICNNMLAYVLHTAFRNHIYITLKYLLNSDVKRRELINFTNFPLETHI